MTDIVDVNVKVNTKELDDATGKLKTFGTEANKAGASASDGMDKVSHASAGTRRELLVLAHEASQGSWSRFGGSLLVLGERMDALRYLTNPATLAVVAFGAAVLYSAYNTEKHAEQLKALQIGFAATGNSFVAGAAQLKEYASSLSVLSGVSKEDAQSALGIISRIPGITNTGFSATTKILGDLSTALGIELPKAAEILSEAFYKPYEAAEKLNHNLNFLSVAELQTIKDLQENGKEADALALLYDKLGGRIKGLHDESLTPFQKSLQDINQSFKDLQKTGAETTSWLDDLTKGLANYLKEHAKFMQERNRSAFENGMKTGEFNGRALDYLSRDEFNREGRGVNPNLKQPDKEPLTKGPPATLKGEEEDFSAQNTYAAEYNRLLEARLKLTTEWNNVSDFNFKKQAGNFDELSKAQQQSILNQAKLLDQSNRSNAAIDAEQKEADAFVASEKKYVEELRQVYKTKVDLENFSRRALDTIDKEIKGMTMGTQALKKYSEQQRLIEEYTDKINKLDQKAVDYLQNKIDLTNQLAQAQVDLGAKQAQRQEVESNWQTGATKATKDYLEQNNNTAKTSQEAFTKLYGSMEEGLTNFALTGKASFGDFTRSILTDLAKIAAQKAIAGIVGALFNSFGGGSTASANGNVFSGGNLMPFAVGGIVNSATTFPMANGGTGLMGEAGPEAIMPLKRLPSGQLGVQTAGGGGSSGGVTIGNINVTVQSNQQDTPQEQADKIGKSIRNEMKALVINEIRNQQRPGNTLNPTAVQKAF